MGKEKSAKSTAKGAKKPTISLCIIVKDEAKFLRACLESVKDLVDEIIIVDTGSTDTTKAIALEFTKKVFDFPWIDDFSAARNEALKHATGDWILTLDADEVIAKEDHDKILQAVQDKEATAFFVFHRDYTNKPISGFAKERWQTVQEHDKYKPYAKDFPGFKPDFHIRLFKNNQNYAYEYVVHEDVYNSILKNKGRLKQLNNVVIHHYGFGEERGDKRGFQKSQKYFDLLRKQVVKTPTHPQPVHTLAMYYFEHGVDAGVGIDKATEQQKEYDLKAIILLQRLLKIYGKFEKAYPLLGKLYERNNKLETAERVYLKSLNLVPKFKDSYILLSSLYFNQGKKQRALQVILKGTKEGILDEDMYLSLGFLLLQNNKPGDAVQVLEKGLDLYKQSTRTDILENMRMNLADAKAKAQSL